MTDKTRFTFVRNVSPYSDGSGYQAAVKVEDTDEGPMISIEMVYRIPLDEWPALRRAADDLITLAQKQIGEKS